MSVDRRIAVMGLGYVGLPLAAAFGARVPTLGFDISQKRIAGLRDGFDRNGEVPPEDLRRPLLTFSDNPGDLQGADFFVVALPTPVDEVNRPDLGALVSGCEILGQVLKVRQSVRPEAPKPIVVFESTVYPGCTEEVCVPELQRHSGLRPGVDFKVGYSPERINPGDKQHTLERVIKIVSGEDDETTSVVAATYELVVKAGVYRARNIKTAEAAKVIENVQRDLNIALMNELALLLKKMDLDTKEVLEAARTKWNFLPFEPGLVGGHCIPVDPYYLTHKAQELGYYPEIILAGRRINDSMGLYVARETVKMLIHAGTPVKGAEVLVIGAAFKENVKDLRNTRVTELVRELGSFGTVVSVYDPLFSLEELSGAGFPGIRDPFQGDRGFDAVVLAVPHREVKDRVQAEVSHLSAKGRPLVVSDVKHALDARRLGEGVMYWSL